jgi:KaiC/GvpD/RAD55 family RecA-like ATPase
MGKKKAVRSRMHGKANPSHSSSVNAVEEGYSEKIPTGIPGLDDILGGGLPRASITMLSGKCGTGRSTFGLQFLCFGASKGEPGIYVTLEKETEEVLAHAKRFDWGAGKLSQNNSLSIVRPDMHKFDTFKKTIEEEVLRIGAKRLVIDPFSLVSAYFHEDPYDVRRSISELERMITRLDCTTILIEDVPEGSSQLSNSGFKEFVVDGVIVLDMTKKDPSSFARTLMVRKMTEANHSLKLVPLEISKQGIAVYPDAEVF